MTDPASPDLVNELGLWQHVDNWQRVHGGLGTTPMDRCLALLPQTPLGEEIAAAFDPVKEPTYHQQVSIRRLRQQ